MLNYYHGSAAQVPKPAAATATNGLKEKLPSLSGEPEPVEAQLSHVVFCFLLPVFMLIEARTLLFSGEAKEPTQGYQPTARPAQPAKEGLLLSRFHVDRLKRKQDNVLVRTMQSSNSWRLFISSCQRAFPRLRLHLLHAERKFIAMASSSHSSSQQSQVHYFVGPS